MEMLGRQQKSVVSEHSPHTAIAHIEALIRHDPGQRGLASFATTRHLLPAAVDLLAGERMILVTGFGIRSARIGENDGPSGTLALADALHRLGKEIVLVTDKYSADLLAAGATLFERNFPTVALNLPQATADREIDALLQRFRPTQVIAIERPGNAIDGHRYSMCGDCLDDLIPGADRFFAPALPGVPRPYRTLGIGDGGNELGLGSLRDELRRHIPLGDRIFAATPADYAIPAGVSNWGAFALIAALSLLSGQRLLHPPTHERAVLEALLAAGAVDGCTKKRELTVDGLDWPTYAEPLENIYRQTVAALQGAES